MDAENLSRVLAALKQQQESLTCLQILIRALLDSHPNRKALLEAFDSHSKKRVDLEYGYPLPDADIVELQAKLAKWRSVIS